jgi:hypothetical protein
MNTDLERNADSGDAAKAQGGEHIELPAYEPGIPPPAYCPK